MVFAQFLEDDNPGPSYGNSHSSLTKLAAEWRDRCSFESFRLVDTFDDSPPAEAGVRSGIVLQAKGQF
jgi:hypothetical protein